MVFEESINARENTLPRGAAGQTVAILYFLLELAESDNWKFTEIYKCNLPRARVKSQAIG